MKKISTNNTKQVRINSLCGLARILDLPIKDIDILDQALTHTSYANEHKAAKVMHNERLEFLGDAVLDLIIGEYLFNMYPSWTEGDLTKAKASIVCEASLATAGLALHLGDYLLLGHGESRSGGRKRPSILADAFEALMGAVYISCSYDTARSFALTHLQGSLQLVASGHYGSDHKTLLQEFVQRKGEQEIKYELRAESGPDHDKTFVMAVYVNGIEEGVGEGKSKKEAEQRAAGEALRLLVMQEQGDVSEE